MNIDLRLGTQILKRSDMNSFHLQIHEIRKSKIYDMKVYQWLINKSQNKHIFYQLTKCITSIENDIFCIIRYPTKLESVSPCVCTLAVVNISSFIDLFDRQILVYRDGTNTSIQGRNQKYFFGRGEILLKIF